MKSLPKMYLCTRKVTSNFGSHLLLDPDIGIFFEGFFFNIPRQGIFPQFGSYLRKNYRIFTIC